MEHVREWMACNFLLLNNSQTLFLVLSKDIWPNKVFCPNFTGGSSTVLVQPHVKSLPFLDLLLHMEKENCSIHRFDYGFICNIRILHNFLNPMILRNLSMLFSHPLNSCSLMLAGYPPPCFMNLYLVSKISQPVLFQGKEFWPCSPNFHGSTLTFSDL